MGLMTVELPIGERISAYRRRRGLSQAALAGLIGRSESWLSQVERGIRSVDRLSVLLDLSKILRVEVDALIGRPWQLAPNGGPLVDGLEEIRQVLSRYSHVVGDVATPSVSLRSLRTDIADLHKDYQAAQYESVIRRLPTVLTAADERQAAINGPDLRETVLVYVSAYVVAAKLLTKLGVADMASLAADRAAMSAGSTDSLVSQGMAIYQVVCALLRADRTDEGEQLAVRMAERLTPRMRSDLPSLVSVTGALWLIAAVTAARRTDRGAAGQRLDTAERLAGLLGRDGNYAWTAFGPTNVAIHRVSVAAELGDPREALIAATALNLDGLPKGLRSRRAQVHLDLAWAQAQRKRDAEAVLHLLEAERTAPEALRYNVIARETVREMLTRAKRGGTSALQGLATRAGVLE